MGILFKSVEESICLILLIKPIFPQKGSNFQTNDSFKPFLLIFYFFSGWAKITVANFKAFSEINFIFDNFLINFIDGRNHFVNKAPADPFTNQKILELRPVKSGLKSDKTEPSS